MTPRRTLTRIAVPLAALTLLASACGSAGSDDQAASPATAVADSAVDTQVAEIPVADPAVANSAVDDAAVAGNDDQDVADTDAVSGATSTFVAEVWADNWFALSVNGVLVGEDSVPITTERSFNAETISFEASYPLTVAVEAKDFKETDSGLEYIGENNQQMGDGGIIIQITDLATGEVVATSDDTWSALVGHRAPLNVECEQSADPDSECEFEIIDVPADWTEAAYDVSGWATATEWSEAAVSPKDGYGQIDWDDGAELIWGADLEVDNTILLRTTVTG